MQSPLSKGSPARALPLLALRVSCLPAIAASAALTREYRSYDPSFCAPDSGCSALRQTDLAHLWGLGVTLPELGLAAFLAIFCLSLTRHKKLAGVLGIVAALLGAVFIALQALALQTFCWLCIVVDLSALAAGVAGAGLAFTRGSATLPDATPPPRLMPGAWLGLAALAVAAPFFWPLVKPAPAVPEAVRRYYEPGKINVVEFADFECPFCRRLHQQLKEQLVQYGDRVNFVRLNMPLESHIHARGAALAAICAEPSGKADALAEFLFTTENLDPAVIRAEAVRLGVDAGAYDACLQAKGTLDRLARESKILREVGFQGLPTTYIGPRQIVGARPPEVFQDALDVAAEQESDPGVPGWAYVLIVLAIATAIVQFGRPRPLAGPKLTPSA